MSVHIVGQFPSPLYKAFDKKEHAQSFAERGSFLMRLLTYYRNIEDSNRKDGDEGEGRMVIDTDRPVYTVDTTSGKFAHESNEFGPVYFGTTSVNPHYILCFSGPQVNVKYLAGKYGQYVIRLCQPSEFVGEVAAHLEQYPDLPNEMWLKCVQVRYDKGQNVSELPEPASEDRTSMSYGQKNPKFASDCEYRLVLTLPLAGNSPPPEIRVQLQKRLEYAELMVTRG